MAPPNPKCLVEAGRVDLTTHQGVLSDELVDVLSSVVRNRLISPVARRIPGHLFDLWDYESLQYFTTGTVLYTRVFCSLARADGWDARASFAMRRALCHRVSPRQRRRREESRGLGLQEKCVYCLCSCSQFHALICAIAQCLCSKTASRVPTTRCIV